jgi:hypothetical protein
MQFLQDIPSKWVTDKIFFLKGLGGANGKSPGFGPGLSLTL